MRELSSRICAALGEFYTDPLFLEKLAAMAVNIAGDDQDYVPGYLLELIGRSDKHVLLVTRICEFFAAEETLPDVCDENAPFFVALPDTTAFVLSNKEIPPIALEACTSAFQDFFLRLRELAKENYGLAKTVMFYGVAMALYEWRDRQRGGVPHDPEIHGQIKFTVRSPNKN